MGETDWDLAVIDMAGTTVSDGGLILRAITEAVRTVAPQREIDLGEVRRLRGAAKRDLFAELTPTAVDAAVDVFNSSLLTLVSDGLVKPVPGAEAAIRSLQSRGTGVCLTTGLDRPVVDAILEQLGWTGLPDQVLTAADAGRGRPHPDLVLSAALFARVAAVRRVVVCGDTVNDLMSGANAGAGLLVGVLTGAHDRAMLESVPDAVIVDSVADLPGLLSTAARSG